MSDSDPSPGDRATVSLADEEGVKRVLIVGFARVQPGTWVYEDVKRLAGDMWAEFVAWAQRYMLRPGFELANPEDMGIPRCVRTADEAMAILREDHARWRLAHGGQG